MKLIELTVRDYLSMLSSSEHAAPGGGSASALMGAQGAGLTSMVCGFTIGKKRYAEYEDLCRDVMEKSAQLKDKLMELIDRDTEAFNSVTAVFAMPKDTEQEKDLRKQAMQAALKSCTVTPFETMEYAAEGLRLAHAVVGKSNQTAASDLGVAALNLRSALLGAWLNVRINLGGIDDQAFADEYRAKGEALIAEVLPLADEVYRLTEEMT